MKNKEMKAKIQKTLSLRLAFNFTTGFFPKKDRKNCLSRHRGFCGSIQIKKEVKCYVVF